MKINNNSPLDDETAEHLDDYLDDRLDAAARAAFEARIACTPDLEAECLLQNRLNQTLHSIGTPEAGHQDAKQIQDLLTGSSPASKPVAASLTVWHKPIMRYAALLAFAAIVGLGLWAGLNQNGSDDGGYLNTQIVDVDAVYTHTIEQGFEPDWVCDNERFTRTISDKLGETITLASLHSDRQMLGLSYLPRARTDTLMMLGRVREKPVLVFFDQPNLVEPFYDLDVPEGLFIHQRDVGKLRVIEVSTESEPIFLDFLELNPHPASVG